MKIHVAEIGVLSDMKADGDGRRVACADLEIDVAHCRIERVFVCVGHIVVRRHAAWGRKRDAAAGAKYGGWTCACKHDHVAHPSLKTGSVVAKQEDWARVAIADETHARPEIDGAREPVAARVHKHNSLANAAFCFVNGRLNRRGVIGDSVAVYAKFLRGEIDRLGIVEPRGEDG